MLEDTIAYYLSNAWFVTLGKDLITSVQGVIFPVGAWAFPTGNSQISQEMLVRPYI